MITYDPPTNDTNNNVEVFLNNRHVGTIVAVLTGWQYLPKGSTHAGEILGTLQDVKNSLES